MCGIAGHVSSRSQESLVHSVCTMMNCMVRRGPDSEGLEQWPGAVLGHRRLAILDLSDAGRQPMLSDDGAVGVVFNGCIYNFLSLRTELEQHGFRFRSNSDTEVLVHGYRHWGIDSLVTRLRGMFAFAVWDDRERRLTLVRDRLGVKPLVYAADGDGIAFASTVEALRRAGFASEIDPEAVLEFLEFGWVSEERTIYQELHKLPAASILEWQDGHIRERRYWTLPEAEGHAAGFEDAVEQTKALLLEAVKLRLISDVPVGVLLSGGIDSALVCWAVAKTNADLTAYTVSTPGDSADEAADAQSTARALGIRHEIIELPPTQQPELDDLVSAYGEPFACPSALAMLRVCKAVKPKVTVLLTGDGGDDVFLGYNHHLTFFYAQRLAHKLPPAFASFWSSSRPEIRHPAALRRLIHLLDYASGGLGAVTAVHDGLPYFYESRLLGERLATMQLPQRQIPCSSESARKLLSDFLAYEYRTRFVSEYLTKVDGAAMHYSVEARSPLLDQVLWEAAASFPHATRLHGGERKAILRAITQREINSEVAGRPKRGFTVPVSRWLTSVWRLQLQILLENPLLERQGWLSAGSLGPKVKQAMDEDHAPLQLWTLVILEQWLRRQNSHPGTSSPPDR